MYNPLAESSYIKLPKDLDHPRKILINIQCIYDNECFKLCLIRYLNPSDCKQVRITRADKDLTKKLDFKYMTFLFIQSEKPLNLSMKKCCEENMLIYY